MSWNITRSDSPTARDVRRSFSDALRERGRTADEISDGTIILGELLANACEHGRLPIQIELRACGERWQLNVKDSGAGFLRVVRAYDPGANRGRGLHMIERLGGTIRVSGGASPNIEVTLPFGD